MADDKVVLTRDEGAVRVVEMHRPEALNAFHGPMFDQLTRALLDAGEDPAIKVVVITGAGRAYSAGADLKAMGRGSGERPEFGFPDLVRAMATFEKPLLAAVNGLAVGVGVTMLGLVDVAVMAEDARVRCPFSNIGLTAEAGSTLLFPQLMGRQRASWLLLSGEWLDANGCVEAGLALETVPTAEVLERTLARARTLAALPSASLRATKRLILEPLREAVLAQAQAEDAALAELVGGPANIEAVQAFAAKRTADFTGL